MVRDGVAPIANSAWSVPQPARRPCRRISGDQQALRPRTIHGYVVPSENVTQIIALVLMLCCFRRWPLHPPQSLPAHLRHLGEVHTAIRAQQPRALPAGQQSLRLGLGIELGRMVRGTRARRCLAVPTRHSQGVTVLITRGRVEARPNHPRSGARKSRVSVPESTCPRGRVAGQRQMVQALQRPLRTPRR
jgi:hypothetical protein